MLRCAFSLSNIFELLTMQPNKKPCICRALYWYHEPSLFLGFVFANIVDNKISSLQCSIIATGH